MVTDNFGVFEDINLPIDKFTNEFFEIYKLTKARYLEVDENPTQTIRYSKEFKQALHLRKKDLRKMVSDEEGIIRDTARTFMTRLLIMMGKISVLCCVAESKDIKDPKKRFIVSGRNVNQASFIIRNCYKSLISWFTHSLKVRKTDLLKNNAGVGFLKAYNELKTDEGLVSKNDLFNKVKHDAKLSKAQIYNRWKKIQVNFEEVKVGRAVFVRLKGEKK